MVLFYLFILFQKVNKMNYGIWSPGSGYMRAVSGTFSISWFRCIHFVIIHQAIHLGFLQFSVCSVQFSRSVMSNSLRPHESKHTRPPCPSPTPGVYSNSSPLSWWCHPTSSSSVVPFSSCLQSFPALGSFQMSQLFASGGQSIGVSASTSVLPVNIQDWFPLGWTGWIQMPSKDDKANFIQGKLLQCSH